MRVFDLHQNLFLATEPIFNFRNLSTRYSKIFSYVERVDTAVLTQLDTALTFPGAVQNGVSEQKLH